MEKRGLEGSCEMILRQDKIDFETVLCSPPNVEKLSAIVRLLRELGPRALAPKRVKK